MNNTGQTSWINVAAGIWLIIAPFVLTYATATPKTNDIILGIIVGVLALIRALNPARTLWLSWVNVAAGIWLIIAPFVLGYAFTTPRWNDIILGIIVCVVALWSTNIGSNIAGTRGHAGV